MAFSEANNSNFFRRSESDFTIMVNLPVSLLTHKRHLIMDDFDMKPGDPHSMSF